LIDGQVDKKNMGTNSEEDKSGPKIDIRTLPESVSLLWESMLRKNPNWDLSKWLDERANEDLELLQSHLGREKLRYEQRLHRIENLAKQISRRRESVGRSPLPDPNQRNLFDVYGPQEEASNAEEKEINGVPLVDLGPLSTDDDLLLAYISQRILIAIEEANEKGEGLHFDVIMRSMDSPGITKEDIDESISWLLQKNEIVEIERDVFIING